jgi:hypothetical protein
MGKKHPHHARNPNVVVPLDPRLFTDLLYRGIGGKFEGELRDAHAEGLTPFERECDPNAYGDSDSFGRDYLLSVAFSKFDDEKSSRAKVDAAMEKFFLAEDRCSDTNSRLYSSADLRLPNFKSARDVLYVARQKIAGLLGDFSWNEAERGFGFGPGATTRLRRDRSTLLHKISGRPEATFNNAAAARAVLQHNRLWEELALNEPGGEGPIKLVRANRVTTVPKNAKTDRVIAIEPDLNIYIQKGIGAMIRHRLRRVGIDLNDQTLNQRLARIGSITGKLATVDLSMASDTVSKAIVEELLPSDWLQALEQCRSPFGVLPSGTEILYRKFSSMGNGYTFELESLIFWALCSALTSLSGEMDAVVGVYGDDLIVPVGIYADLERLLEYCGFSFNRKKSFAHGPFRESCGKHYFLGCDVSPFYVRKQPRRLTDAFLLHNNVIRWSNKGAYRASGVDGLVERFCLATRNAAPSNWRKPRIPLHYGDGAFVGSFDEATPARAGRGFEGFRATVLSDRVIGRRCHSDYPSFAPVAASLFLLEKQHRGGVHRRLGGDSVRNWLHRHETSGRSFQEGGKTIPSWADELPTGSRSEILELVITRTKTTKVLVTQWADLGPWY